MTQELSTTANQIDTKTIEQVLIGGNLANLTTEQRTAYYASVCKSIGLNPLTKPFDYITLNGKLTLYARKDATEQLRRQHNLSIKIVNREKIDDIYIVTAQATMPDGRCDESTGAVSVMGLKGEALANCYMKAECVPVEYEILTKEGFKTPHDLKNDDIVASVSLDGEIYWTKIKGISFYKQQNVCQYGNSAIEFEITEGHKWIAKSFSGKKELKPFDKISNGSYILLTAKSNDAESILTEKEAATLGWIITDGTIKKYKGDLYRASICQSKKENFKHIEWAISGIGVVSTGITDNRTRNWMDQKWWYLSKAQTQSLFNKCGFTGNASLPGIVLKLGSKERESMLAAMMYADGDKRNIFGKGDINIMEAFQILCALTGRLTSKLRVRKFAGYDSDFYIQSFLSYNKVAKQNLKKIGSRVTDVWCPTTEHGTWICKTVSGQILVTGNTKAKRRVTLSICGLGMLDESEVESIDGEDNTKRPVRKDANDGTGTGSGNTTSSKLNQAVTGTAQGATPAATSTNQPGNTPNAGPDRSQVVEAEITPPVKNDPAPTGESKSGTATAGSGKTDRKTGGKAKPDAGPANPPTVQPEQGSKDTIKAQLFEAVVSKREADGRTRFGCKAGGVYYGTYSGEIADRVQQAINGRHLMNITYNIRSENDVTKRDIISLEQSDLDECAKTGELPPIA